MELGLRGKNAIITGGSAGIGFACAQALVQEGANILIIGRNEERLAKAIDSLKLIANNQAILSMQADLTNAESSEKIVNEAVHQFGQIDILINNAGAARAGSFWSLGDNDFLEAWNLKLLGYIRMVRAVAEIMKNKQYGRILNIIGTGGKNPSATFLPGGTANAALINFTKGVSKELAKYGIRINAISPAVTETERAQRLAEQKAEANGISKEEQLKREHAATPLGSMIQPEEIANMALLLVSDLIPSMTGSEVTIDAGITQGI